MIDDDKAAPQSRPVETTEGAMDEYKARQEAERQDGQAPKAAACG